SDRSRVVRAYSDALVAGNPAKGQLVFNENCKVCHTLDKQERIVGPDLRSLTNRSYQYLLTSILDPNQNIEPKYVSYSFELKNGQVLSGLISSEGSSSLTTLNSEGRSQTVLRSSIESVNRSTVSIMPEGFETKISPAEMSDLIEFIREL
ncbi:MAG: c-type cytochrome, partial [Planctomycetales bacterium]|nr:c-type cytochrome [Planctomycetales bacterium]